VAGKILNMRTVWARELVLDKLELEAQKQKEQSVADETAKKATPEEELLAFQKKISEKTVVKMSIGSDDYLMDSIQSEYADSIIDNFADLATVLQKWHDESLEEPAQVEEVDAQDTSQLNGNGAVDTDPLLGFDTTAVDVNGITTEEQDMEDDEMLAETKFCVFCGTKVPAVAVHCSSCGKKQPQL
jgi:ribosomal protein L40E